MLTSSAVEIEEAAGGEVHPLLALAVVVQGDLLRLHGKGTFSMPASADFQVKTLKYTLVMS